MAKDRLSGKLAVILHADVAGSTALVVQDEQLAHQRIQRTFHHFSNFVIKYHGHVRELRGDALLAEFERASDAVIAALAFQVGHSNYLQQLNDSIQPTVRIGIAMGEVIVADNTITGEGVVLAQRLEQLAKPGSVVIQGAAHETIPGRFPFEYDDLGEHAVKGFDNLVRAHSVSLKPGSEIPQSELLAHKARRSLASIASITIIIAGIALMWFEPWVIREEPASLERMAFPLPDKPSIAVLPFDNMSGDPEQEYFVDGLTEDLITDLSKLDGLFVIARNSVFSYKGRSVKVNQVAEELGVRYVLEGSVRRVADQVRINAQLIDTTTGGHIWADRYDGALENVFDLQDQIAARILSALQLRLTGTGQESKGQHYKKQLDAYDSLLKGLAVGGQRSREANLEARGFFLEAIEFDPGFARAYSALANTYRIAHRNGWSNLPERSLDTAYDLVVKALELEETLPQVHFVKSLVHRERKELKLAIASAERAIDLDPNYADALVALASILCYGGKSAEGLALMERAKRLNPHYPSHYPFHEGQCYFVKANYAEAINAFDRAAEQTPDSQRVHVWLAASHILSGNQDEAEWEADNVKVLNPGFSVQEMKYVVPLKDPKHLEAFIKALEKAGLPE